MKGVWFDILPRMVGLQAEADKVVVESEKAGQKAGNLFGKAFGEQATSASSKTVATMKAQADSAASALESASARTVKAHDLAADAAGRARSAEVNLAAVRQKYSEDSVQYVRAEEALAKAKRDTATASGVAQTAAVNENKVFDDAAAKKAALAGKQDEVTKSSGTMAAALKGAATIGVGALIVGTGEAIKSAANFQETQTRLVTTAGLSKASLDTVSQGILGMAGQVGDSAQDLSKAMYTVSSGMTHVADPAKDAANALEILKASAQGAAQEGAPLKEVVDAVTGSLKDYEMPISNAADVTSKMITAVAHGKTTFGDLTGALGQVEAQAATAKVPFDDLLASVSQLTIHNISAEQGSQNLNAAIRTLLKPSADATNALANMGISSSQLGDDLKNKGISGTMEEISRAIMDHIGPSGKVMVDAFTQSKTAVEDAAKAYAALPAKLKAVADQVKAGSITPTVGALEKSGLNLDDAHVVSQWATMQAKSTGLNSNLTSLKNSNQGYQQMMQSVMGNQETARVADMLTGEQNQKDIAATKADEGAAKPDAQGNVKGWSEVQGNFNQKMKETKAGVGALAISIGTDLLPAATKFLGYLQEGGAYLDKHKTATEGVVVAIGGLVTAWASIKVAQGVWSGLTTVANGASAAIKGVGTAANAAGGLISSGAGAVKNVATSAMDWWSWTGKAKAAAVGDFVATKASAVSESVASGAAWVKQGVVAGGAWVGMQAKAVGAFVATKASAVASATESGAAWLASNARAAGSFLLTQGAALVTAGATGAVTAAQWLWNVAMDANPIGAVVLGVTALVAGIVLLVTHWNDVTKAWDWTYKNVLTPVGHWFQHTWNDDIVPPFKTGIDGITGFFKSMGSDIHGVWVDIVHGVAWVIDKIASAFDSLPSAIHIPGTDISTPDFKALGREMHTFAGMAMDYKADGGLFRGAGGPRDDRNLVAVSDGEYWVNADSTAKNLPLLERINRGEKVLARADGGLVGAPESAGDPNLGADSGVTAASSSPATAAGTKSGLQVALDAIRAHISTMYEWGGGNLSSGVDCSGLVGDAQLLATGGQPDHRLGNTDTLLQGGWPGMIKGATSSDYFIAGVNDHHMVASILGQNIEARQSGEHIRMGSDAVSPFDTQFIAQYHLDPSLIQPPYQPGASGDPTAAGGAFTGLPTAGATASDKAAKYRAAAQKELDAAKKHDAEAQKYMDEAAKYKDGLPAAKAKHLDAMKRYLDEATKADALAAKSTGAAKQRHIDAAAHDRELAQKAQDAAGKVGGGGQKYLDEATKARQLGANERKTAQEDMAKADQAMNTPAKTKGSKSGVDANGGWMTFKQFNEHLADVATDFITDSTGMPSWISDPNQSAVLRIGKQLTNIRPKNGTTFGAPNWNASPFLPATNDQTTDQQDLSSLLPATHDLGGPIPPGLSLVNNKTGGDEVLVINPQLMGQRQPEPVAASSRSRGRGGNAPALLIQHYHAASNDQAEANRLGRTVGQYSRQR